MIAARLNFLFFHRSDVWRSFGRSIGHVGWALVILYFVVSLLGEIAGAVSMFDINLGLVTRRWIYAGCFIIATVMLVSGVVAAVMQKMRARKTVRQQSAHGELSGESLARSLGDNDADKSVIACMEATRLLGKA